MNTTLVFSIKKRLRVCGWIAVCTLAAASLGAQSVTPRIQSEITLSEVSPLKGSAHPLAQARFDVGRLPANTRLNSISIVFKRSAAQEADLQALIAAQQNPASPLYHQWLNPDQFGARFGMAQADLDKVQTWLQQQGFSIDSVARGRNMIRFSGTARQVENAFSTQMHYYKIDGEQHFASSTELSVPAAVAPAIAAVRNLSDFRPKPMHVRANSKRARPSYTYYYSNSQQAVLFAPGDIKVAYDINPLASAGFTGTGQRLRSWVNRLFRSRTLKLFRARPVFRPKTPTTVLVPGTGSSTIFQDGNEGESDIDLEWSSATATGADIIFVYTGSDTTAGVFDSVFYTIEENLAPIISISYGSCEPASSQSDINATELVLAQGAAQGQTIVASSGDQGSTACSGNTSFTTAQQEVLAVSYPASSAYITAVGGTEITSANDAVGPYWSAAPSTSQDALTSALQYIPEVAWNDDPSSGQFTVAQGGRAERGRGRRQHIRRQTELAGRNHRRHQNPIRELSPGAGCFPVFIA